jgi:hypothetical protein
MRESDVRPNMKARVLRNTCSAFKVGNTRFLEPGDIIVLTGKMFRNKDMGGYGPLYYRDDGVLNYINLEDVEPIDSCVCSNQTLMISGCRCGEFQNEYHRRCP